jgi:hypothetical protein
MCCEIHGSQVTLLIFNIYSIFIGNCFPAINAGFDRAIHLTTLLNRKPLNPANDHYNQ